MIQAWVACVVAVIIGRFIVPDYVWDIMAVLTILATGAWAIFAEKEEDKMMEYIQYLLLQKRNRESDAVGARLAVQKSGAVEFANEWRMTLPDDTVRDFVVKFDGWDESEWTMWARMPWGKYKEHKAEVDFSMGRNIMKEMDGANETSV